jgi:Na+-transporting NADH:ubiquinone oxidoreductase subunit NqrB
VNTVLGAFVLLIAAIAGWQIIDGVRTGQIDMGIAGWPLANRLTTPLRYWCYVVWHMFVLVFGTVVAFDLAVGSI